ncbi:hypothetical protein SPRG_01134 [Saprolegnia parasitica CBS 223.65]|uniref:MATE efflux family protein n=1 Tax=Saprolegnia parasitica (strain CBS 223.65) TaxID=695850 RepID=A0A067D0P5_SAPPC|nr:hypothetical protein SPRG_01134 [Saprolegnia parasitica CBS 223.65]KDO35070.1 hypothetical protein SPRG_01134 [Saprolegnia parasitica CBS 223.65]|eukprot:XP_012194723.1 hypothetical protein SPRG_01134 [Saprolegnia parasitica CBS 223.65]
MAIVLGFATAVDTLGSKGPFKRDELLPSACMAFAVMCVPMGLLNVHAASILRFLGQDPSLALLAGEIIQWSTLGLPFLFLYEVLKKQLHLQGIVGPPILVAITSNVLHIALGYSLSQFTSLGVVGVGIARAVAYLALPGLLLWHMQRRGLVSSWALPTRASICTFARYGLPGTATMQLEWGALALLVLVSGMLPDPITAVGVNSIFVTLLSLLYVLFYGLSLAIAARLRFFLAANRPRHAAATMQLGYAVCIVGATVTCSSIFFGRSLLSTVFLAYDPSIRTRATLAVLFVVPLHFFDALNAVSQGILRGIDRPGFATCVNVVAYYVVGLLLAAYCAFFLHLDLEGLWIGYALGLVFAGGVYWVLLSHISWKRMAFEAFTRAQVPHLPIV